MDGEKLTIDAAGGVTANVIAGLAMGLAGEGNGFMRRWVEVVVAVLGVAGVVMVAVMVAVMGVTAVRWLRQCQSCAPCSLLMRIFPRAPRFCDRHGPALREA